MSKQYRFRVAQNTKTDVWMLINDSTGESVYGYASKYAAMSGRNRLENGDTFYDQGQIDDFIAKERELNKLLPEPAKVEATEPEPATTTYDERIAEVYAAAAKLENLLCGLGMTIRGSNRQMMHEEIRAHAGTAFDNELEMAVYTMAALQRHQATIEVLHAQAQLITTRLWEAKNTTFGDTVKEDSHFY